MIVLGGVLHALEDWSASLGPDARWEACRGLFSGETSSYNEIDRRCSPCESVLFLKRGYVRGGYAGE